MIADSWPLLSSLLVAQDREEIYLIIGEWDTLYEEYALHGKLSDKSIQFLDHLQSNGDTAARDAGFLTMNVYGPYNTCKGSSLSKRGPMESLSKNLLALALHLSQASCSPSSQRPSPPGSIQLPPPRGEPCCAGCTCKCRCRPPPGSQVPSDKAPSETSELGSGSRQESRERSSQRAHSTKSTASHSSSQGSEGQQATPSRAPRPPAGTRGAASVEIRAGLARGEQERGRGQAREHDTLLPLRERPAASDPQSRRSEASSEQSSLLRSRPRDPAAAGPQGQAPAPAGPSQHTRGPGPGPAPGQPRQPLTQGQRDPAGQPRRGTQPQPPPTRDPRHGPTGSAIQKHGGTAHPQHQPQPQPQVQRQQAPSQPAVNPQRPHHDPHSGPGPSHPPSSYITPSRPPQIDTGGPSESHCHPAETPIRKDRKKSPAVLSPKGWFGKSKEKKDKKDRKGKGRDDKEGDEGDGTR
jgi:hypothetical protein